MNDLQFAGRYKCLPISCSGLLISLQDEHPVYVPSADYFHISWQIFMKFYMNTMSLEASSSVINKNMTVMLIFEVE
jgi:hypothetical protein